MTTKQPTHTAELYALHVKGDTMLEASIHDGDIVVMKHQAEAQDGELVAVWMKNEQKTRLRKFYHGKGGMIRLEAANPTYVPLVVEPKAIQIQGKVVLVIRSLA